MNEKTVLIPDDYNDFIYRIIYHCLGKVAGYVPRSIKPNHITIAGFLFALISTLFLFFMSSPAAFLYWIVFNFAWFLLDALDGIHARFTKQTSEFGAFLDHSLDNIYFIFMFTAFAVRFDLMYPLYIYILLLRITAALLVFTVQVHTRRLYLGKFSGGTELLIFSAAMFFSYLFPSYNPVNHTTNHVLLYWINFLHLQQGMFMKLVLMVYFFGVPINTFLQFRFVKRVVPN